MKVSELLRQAMHQIRQAESAAHFSQELSKVMHPLVDHSKGKLTSGDRTPNYAEVKKVLTAIIEAAKTWETKERKILVEGLRSWIKLAREHADRLNQAVYKGGASYEEVGEARSVRDLLDGTRAQILKLPSLRARGPSKKSLEPKQLKSTEKGINRILEILPEYLDLMKKYKSPAGKSTDQKKMRELMREAYEIIQETEKQIGALPDGKEKTRAIENLRKFKRTKGFDFSPGSLQHSMEYGRPEELKAALPTVIAIWKEIQAIIHGQQLLFAAARQAQLARRAESGDQAAYRAYFQRKLKEWGIKSPADLDEAKKKKFFQEVNDGWTSDEEKKGSPPPGASYGCACAGSKKR